MLLYVVQLLYDSYKKIYVSDIVMIVRLVLYCVCFLYIVVLSILEKGNLVWWKNLLLT